MNEIELEALAKELNEIRTNLNTLYDLCKFYEDTLYTIYALDDENLWMARVMARNTLHKAMNKDVVFMA